MLLALIDRFHTEWFKYDECQHCDRGKIIVIIIIILLMVDSTFRNSPWREFLLSVCIILQLLTVDRLWARYLLRREPIKRRNASIRCRTILFVSFGSRALPQKLQRGQVELEFVKGTLKKPQRSTNNVIDIKIIPWCILNFENPSMVLIFFS